MSKMDNLLACVIKSIQNYERDEISIGEIQIWDYLACFKKSVIITAHSRITGICFSNNA